MGSVPFHAAAIVSGLLAAFCAAVGIVVRQRAAQRVPAGQSEELVTVVQNAALHAGALQASVPIMLVGEPVVAVLLGMVVLGEHVGVRGPGAIVLVVTVWAMVTATVALARSQAGERAAPSARQRYSSCDPDARLTTAGVNRALQ